MVGFLFLILLAQVMISHVPAHYIPFLTNLVGFISQIINISLHDPDQEVSKAWVSECFKITLYMAFTGSKSQLNWRDFEALSPKWSDFLIVHIKTFNPHPPHSLPLQKLIISKYCWTMIQSSPTPNLFHDILHPFSYHIIKRHMCIDFLHSSLTLHIWAINFQKDLKEAE